MESHFSSSFFAGNRRRLQELFTGTAPIVVTANGLLQRGGDSPYKFSQDANFWYLTGIDEPDIMLVIDRDAEYLIVPERSSSRQAFDGAISDEDLSRRSGIKTVYEGKAGWEKLNARLKNVKHAATVAVQPAFIDQLGLYTNPARAHLVARLKEANHELELLELGPALRDMRMIKQAPELAALQQAIDITAASLEDVWQSDKLRQFAAEYEVEAALGYGFRTRGAAGHAFDPIIAGGARAVTLHNVANNGRLSADELLLMDVGAEVEHYAADITRTRSLRQPSRRQEQVHQAVLETQAYAFSLLKPGAFLHEYEQRVETFIGEQLEALGVISQLTHETIRAYCPHSISHFLGLNVHDIGDYDRPLEAGTVLTVEPGIYIPEDGIGVRIEDDVLITDDGIRILSDTLSRALR